MQLHLLFGLSVLTLGALGCGPLYRVPTKTIDPAESDARYLKPYFGKQYIRVGCDNKIDSLLDAMGFGTDAKNIAKSAKAILVLEHLRGGKYNLKYILDDKTHDFQFELDKQFKYTSFDGRKVTAKVQQAEYVLTEFDKWTDAQGATQSSRTTRIFFDDRLKVVTSVGEIMSTCSYKPKV